MNALSQQQGVFSESVNRTANINSRLKSQPAKSTAKRTGKADISLSKDLMTGGGAVKKFLSQNSLF